MKKDIPIIQCFPTLLATTCEFGYTPYAFTCLELADVPLYSTPSIHPAIESSVGLYPICCSPAISHISIGTVLCS